MATLRNRLIEARPARLWPLLFLRFELALQLILRVRLAWIESGASPEKVQALVFYTGADRADRVLWGTVLMAKIGTGGSREAESSTVRTG